MNRLSSFMNRLLQWEETPIMMAWASALAKATSPFILSSLFLLLFAFPNNAYQDFWIRMIGEQALQVTKYLGLALLFSSLFVILYSVLNSLAKKDHQSLDLEFFISASLSFLWLILFQAPELSWLRLLSGENLVLSFLFSVFFYFLYQSIVPKIPDWKTSLPPMAVQTFRLVLIPALPFLLLVLLNSLSLSLIHLGLFGLLNLILIRPLYSLSTFLIVLVIIEFLMNLVWTTGLHGTNIFMTLFTPFWLIGTLNNAKALVLNLPQTSMVTLQFIDHFVHMGGSGATLGFIIFLFFASKNKERKALAREAILPNFFNINEFVIYGLPIFQNKKAYFSFLATPIVNLLITYFAMRFALVPHPTGFYIPWFTPPILSGFLVTGSLSGAFLQLFLLVIDALLYFPLLKSEQETK